ncbi:MAG TPA: UvrB/UvrC motif-containing protein [Opitutales bacterium]|nr:UvrB/UvrC motif-containing protein [Opitutales bacterium]
MGQSFSKICAHCGVPAKVFVTLSKSGQTAAMAWCDTHAGEAGVLDPKGYALLEATETPNGRRNDGSLRCPVCDCSQRDFERQGRFGCPACYTAFAGLLPTLLGRMHRDVVHHGKIPLRGAGPAVVRHRLARLQAELNNAVRTQEFEGAAQTRDAIALLKAKLPDAATESPEKPSVKNPSS